MNSFKLVGCLLTAILASAVFSSSVLAVGESSLPAKFKTEILPYYESGRSGTFVGNGGLPIAYKVFAPSSGAAPLRGAKAIVLLNGRSEFMRKYAEMIYDLKDSGYAIYTMDHRGQGESGRILPESEKGYVSAFTDYVEDLGTFVNQVVRPDAPSEIHVIAHSMGAIIATMYAMNHPDAFRSMVLSSPMYQPNLGKYSEDIALMIAWFDKIWGWDLDVAPGRTLDEWKSPFEGNNVTTSEIRYDNAKNILLERPGIAVGGPTVHWVREAIRAGRWVREYANYIKTPVRILQATDEHVVVAAAENEVCSMAASCEIIPMDESKHEILMERDPIRSRAQALALDFIRKH